VSDGEFDLIERAFRDHAPPANPYTSITNGDDASVHGIPSNMELAISSDASVSGVHWPEAFPLEQAADRAACAALSDLAAMGAEACWLWSCVQAVTAADAERMGQGINAALHRYGVELAGGDTVYSSVNAISLTVGGVLPRGEGMRRDAGSHGDDLWLWGTSGFASFGLSQWQEGHHNGDYTRYFSTIRPLLKEGIRLRRLGVRCCIDVSDGLLQDATHLARASGMGLQIWLDRVPGWRQLADACSHGLALSHVLAGGEDYALLFTAPVGLRSELDGLASRIGACSREASVRVLLHGKPVDVSRAGFDHFA